MRRPWNIIDMPVYSLATYAAGTGHAVNMNICTYVMAVSRKPKLYAIALEHGSRTLHNLEENGLAVLQLLRQDHMSLVRPLGKRSGHDFDKIAYLRRQDLLGNWKGQKVLRDAAAYLLLEVCDQRRTGDHELFTFSVRHSRTLSESEILMFHDLIDRNMILS